MPQSLAQIYIHLVFSTKERYPFLLDRNIRDETFRYLSGGCKNLDCPSLAVGGMPDHIHILCRFGRSIAIADLVRELKKESSAWLKEKSPKLSNFHWQNGYGAFSISPDHVTPLCNYIATQEAHHEKESFQDEFRRILTKYQIKWDERYVWD